MGGLAIIDTSTFINIKHINRFDLIENLKYYLATTIYVILEINDGKEDTIRYYNFLKSKEKIQHVTLELSDLIEMARVPNSRRISDPELSCIVKARQFRCSTFCDDKKAIKYAQIYIPIGVVIGIRDILIESFQNNLISEYEMRNYENTLNNQGNLVTNNLFHEAILKKTHG